MQVKPHPLNSLTTHLRRMLLLSILGLLGLGSKAQKDTSGLDGLSSEEADLLFSELESLLDSVTQPKSFMSVSLMAGNRLLNVKSQAGKAATSQALMLSPSLSYNHKSGFGLAASAALISADGQLKPSQYLGTVSYDYLKLPGVLTGIAYTRFIRPDSVAHYTSPLKNEVSLYMLYRKSWIKPSVSFSYGWGTKKEVTEQAFLVDALRRKRKRNGTGGTVPVTNVTSTTESISDYMVSVSARHDFYFFNVLSKKDNFRITPQLSCSGGTQRYGFNQSTNTFLVKRSEAANKPFYSDQVALQEATKFQPLSVSAFLRSSYSKGIFFFQPQVILDYYLPAASQNFTTTFAVNTGLVF